MMKVYAALVALSTVVVSSCSSLSYSENTGASSYIPYDKNPSYSNVELSDEYYTPPVARNEEKVLDQDTALGGEMVQPLESAALTADDKHSHIPTSPVPEPQVVEQPAIKYEVVNGTFADNVERLASQFGFSPVIWDKRVAGCTWEQVTAYELPEKEPRAAIGYYVGTLDFQAVFSDVDNHLQIVYVGPESRIKDCE